jgi:hypothetical protein
MQMQARHVVIAINAKRRTYLPRDAISKECSIHSCVANEIASGAKAQSIFLAAIGMAEAMPFQNRISS